MRKPHPLCWTPQALPNTMRIHGLDELLGAIEPLLYDEQGPSEYTPHPTSFTVGLSVTFFVHNNIFNEETVNDKFAYHNIVLEFT